MWDDGTPLGYSNWHTGEPNNGGSGATYQEDCTIIAGARVGAQWDDRPCDASEVPNSGTFAYLCDIDPVAYLVLDGDPRRDAAVLWNGL